MQLTDQQLIRQIQAGDAHAFELLFARYRRRIHRHVVRIVRNQSVAEDLVPEVFLRVWTHADQWDGRGGVKPWLYRIGTNLALNQLRSVRRRPQQPLEPLAEAAYAADESPVPGWLIDTATVDPEVALEATEQHRLLRRLIETLPDAKREVFRLIYEAELDIQDVADMLDIPTGTVKSRLHYGKKQLARRGLEVAKRSGASLNPFIGADLKRAPVPAGDDPRLWDIYAAQLAEQLAAHPHFEADFGPRLLAVKSGARGQISTLATLLGTSGAVADVTGQPVVIRHGYRDGLSSKELYALVASSREWLAEVWCQYEQVSRSWPESSGPKRFNVLARARRTPRPGLVFARAAAMGESDPLLDVDSRLFVGLPPDSSR